MPRLPSSLRSAHPESALLAQRLAEATAAWPIDWLPIEDLITGLIDRIPVGMPLDDFLREVKAEDLYLALACGRGHRKAIEAFEARMFPDVDIAIRRLWGPVTWLADFKQDLREKLFVATPNRRPLVLEYGGRGTLRAWLRVIVVRDAINRQTRGPKDRSGPDADLPELPSSDISPEINFDKHRYSRAFHQAFAYGLSALSVRDRALLRHRFVDGMTLEQLATTYDVDRATVVRWLARSRSEVIAKVRDQLVETARISEAEVGSLIRLVRSQLYVTVTRLLDPQSRNQGSGVAVKS